jgi:RNB domain
LQQHEVTAEHEQNLRLLHSIGVARVIKATSRGAIDFCDSNFSVSVLSKRHMFHRIGDSPHGKQYNVDPVIRLAIGEWDPDTTVTPANLVRELMLLGGEIAARWCHERGIPIVYRVTQSNPEQPNPTEFFRKKILPYINHSLEPRTKGNSPQQDISKCRSPVEGVPSEDKAAYLPSEAQGTTGIDILPRVTKSSIPIELKFEYLGKLGSVLPSTTVGPHVALGLQMFAKATSPLRRCGDLLTHWQIEAALLEEARTGMSLIGSGRRDYLPFQKSEVDNLLPHLDTRERLMSIANAAAQRVWAIQLLVRAWKFNEAPLPPTFEFIVRDVSLLNGSATGQLTYFGGLRADMNIPKWIEAENVNPRDVFEVELEALNVYKQQINVTGLRRIKAVKA